MADQGGCGACTVLLHAPADTMLLAPNPCMANACLRPLHSFPGCNCTSAHIPQIAGYLHISPMVFQCTFCYHAPKVLVFRKFAVSHSFNVVTRNFRFTSKKKHLTLRGVEDERLGGDHHRKSWNSKSSTSDPIGFCEAQCQPMWSLDQASTLFDLKTIRKLFREVMDLFFND